MAIKFIVFDLTRRTGLAEVPIIYYLSVVVVGVVSNQKHTEITKFMSFNFSHYPFTLARTLVLCLSRFTLVCDRTHEDQLKSHTIYTLRERI